MSSIYSGLPIYWSGAIAGMTGGATVSAVSVVAGASAGAMTGASVGASTGGGADGASVGAGPGGGGTSCPVAETARPSAIAVNIKGRKVNFMLDRPL